MSLISKKLLSLLTVSIIAISFSTSAVAFLHTLNVLEKKEISELSDEVLLDNYIDVLVEMEASKTFHETAGFSPKEYKNFKELLRYRLLLQIEIHERELTLPEFKH